MHDLEKFYIEIDGKESTLDNLDSLMPRITKTIEYVHREIINLSWKEIAKKYAEIYWMRKKPLRDILNKDWRISSKIMHKIEDGKMNPKMLRNMSEKEIDLLISTII